MALGVIVFACALASLSPAPVFAQTTTLAIGVTADATLASDTPTTNHGASNSLSVDGRPAKHALLRFQVAGVGSATVTSAVLRLYVTNASPVGGQFFEVPDDTWNESAVTWQTAPAAQGGAVASLGPVSKGLWYEVDLSSLVTGEGVYSLRVTSSSSNGADYASREAPVGQRPEVVLTLQDSTPPSVEITNPPEGATVSEIVTLQADATDDVGVASVAFLVDGVLRWTDDTSPFTFDWGTRSVPNGLHALVASAVDGAGNVGTSGVVTVLVDNPPDLTAPTAPSGLFASVVGSTSIQLSWTPSVDDVGVDHYVIFRDGTEIATAPAPPFTDTSLAPSTTYDYAVTAVDAAGNVSPMSNIAQVTTAEPSSSFTFAAAGDHGANPQSAASLAALDSSGASFYLALGDLDYDETPTDAAWCDYVKQRLPTLGPQFPFEVGVGNHEDDNGMDGHILNHAACLPDRLGATIGPSSSYGVEYYFDYPAADPLVRVIMIAADHTVSGINYDYTVGSARYQWLSATIDGARAAQIPWVAVGTHKPCLSASGGCSGGEDLTNLLVEKRVDLVLNGHHHNYQRSKQLQLDPSTCPAIPAIGTDIDCVQDDGADDSYTKGAGPVFVIAGSFGAGLSSIDPADPEAPYFARTNGTSFGFVSYAMTRDRLDATFVASSGTFSDSFSILAGAAQPDIAPPTVPTGLIGSASSGTTVSLTWQPSTDDVGVDHYDVFRDGAQLASTPSTSYSDATVSPGATHAYSVRAVDAAGNASALSGTVTVTTSAAGATLTFEPVADTYVSETNPTTSYGSSSKFAVDGSPREHALMKFAVSGVGSTPILSAKLRLYNTNGSSFGGLFFPVADAMWGETTTWNTAPAAGPIAVASLGAVTAGTWYEVDLTSFITGDGVYSLRVTSTSSNGADYTSRQGTAGFHPQLVVVLGAS